MPFIPHTPEGLLVRNRHSSSNNCSDIDGGGGGDGSNETCRGVTARGAPCRRMVATARTFRHEEATGFMVMSDVALYCWQHKDQAQHVVNAALEEDGYAHTSGGDGGGLMSLGAREMAKTKGRKEKDRSTANAPMLRERSSIDTLVVRLGMIDIDGNAEKKVSGPDSTVGQFQYGNLASKRNKEKVEQEKKKKSRMPMVDGKEGHDDARQYSKEKRFSNSGRHGLAHNHRGRPNSRKKSSGSRNWLSTFCLAADPDDDYFEIVRHKSRVADQARRAEMALEARNGEYDRVSSQPVSHQLQSYGGKTHQVSGLENETRLDLTSHLLSFIPKSLSPQLTWQLQAELLKPISPSDDEGYIYMFRLIDNQTRTSFNTTSSLLSPNHNHNHNSSDRNTNMDKVSPGRRRMSSNMNTAAAAAAAAATATTTTAGSVSPQQNGNNPILLKIGRASNVHRRMNEWTRQCDYNLSLLRWYPYPPWTSSPPANPIATTTHNQPQRRRSSVQQAQAQAAPPTTMNNESTPAAAEKVPHVRRVERLIHIELAEKRIKRVCAACGKEHREWFEIESSRVGLRAVDEVIRRWVRWSFELQERQ